jgi:selenocysteine lyase/cysteine desulfurase
MTLDSLIDPLRNETPGCRNILHFNNAGCSLAPQSVMGSVLEHLQLEQQLGGYAAAEQAAGQIENFYRAFAGLLNCETSEIAYIENATRAWDMVFYAIPFQPGDQVLTGQSEYASNLLAMRQLEQRFGIEIVVVPNTGAGTICLDSMAARITDRTRLIALTHIASQVGTIQPAEQVGRLARERGVLYLLDACQSAGQLPIDTQQIQCDLLTGTGRKYLRGPRGTGFLFVRRAVLEQLEPPFIDQHSATWTGETSYRFRDDARRFENWECFVAGKIGLGTAVDYACQLGLSTIRERIARLAKKLAEQLTDVPGVTVHEHIDNLSGIITFSRTGEPAGELQQRLRGSGINTSVARQANAALDARLRNVGDVNRASLHYYNTEQEIERFVEVLSAS